MANSNPSVDDYVLIWLDATIDKDAQNSLNRKSLLETFIDHIQTFTDENECIKYIQAASNEKVILVVSGALGEAVVPSVHDMAQLFQIYIFCADINKHKQWAHQYSKVRGVFNDENRLVDTIRTNVKVYTTALMTFCIGNSQERTLQDIDEEQVGFLWFQLMVEVICRLSRTAKSKEHMKEEYSASNKDNPTQLRILNEFFDTYTSEDAIKWYTKDCCLHKLLNKAFRHQDIDTIFKYHYFLNDLTEQLTNLYLRQFSGRNGILVVYRGQSMHKNEFERLRASVGHLVSINTFFSTSTKCIVAVDFCGKGERRSEGLESVLFEINIDLSVRRSPFAHIHEFSSISDESEVLFGMGSVFLIEEVEEYTDDIWLVKLKLSQEVKKEVEDLLSYFKKHIAAQTSLVELGVLLSKVGDYERAKKFYQLLFDELPENHYDIGVLHNNLGEIYRQQGHLDMAMDHYQRAIDEMVESAGFLHPWFAVIHSNMGLVYNAQQQYDQALIHFRCALFLLNHIKSSESELFSTIYHGMACAHQAKNNFDISEKLLKQSLQIDRLVLPHQHPSIAMTHVTIGNLYFLKDEVSKALDILLEAESMLSATLPNSNPELVSLYILIGQGYAAQKRLSEAISFFAKAEETVKLSSISYDHTLYQCLYTGFAPLLIENKMYDRAIKVIKTLIEILESSKTPNLYEIAEWTNILGFSYWNIGDRDQASESHQLAANIAKQLPRTSENKDLYSRMACSLIFIKRYDLALEHFSGLLNEEVDKTSLFAAKINNNLGVIYEHMKKEHLAIEHYAAALYCYSKRPDICAKEMAITNYNIAVIQQRLGKFREALINLHSTLNILSENEIEIRIRCYWLLGQNSRSLGHFADAVKYLRQTLEWAIQIHGSENPLIASYRSDLEEVTNMLKQFDSMDLAVASNEIEKSESI